MSLMDGKLKIPKINVPSEKFSFKSQNFTTIREKFVTQPCSPKKHLLHVGFISQSRPSISQLLNYQKFNPSSTRAKKRDAFWLIEDLEEKRARGSIRDSNSKMTVGNEAIQNFFSTCRNIQKISEKNKFFEEKDSPMVQYINYCRENSVPALPNGLVKRRGKQQELKFPNQSIGDRYALGLCSSIKKLQFEEVNAQNNRLTDKGAQVLINKDLKNINLAKNKLGTNSVQAIQKVLIQERSVLAYLNLEQTQISDTLASQLIECITYCRSLHELNLAKNNLSIYTAYSLAQLFAQNK